MIERTLRKCCWNCNNHRSSGAYGNVCNTGFTLPNRGKEVVAVHVECKFFEIYNKFLRPEEAAIAVWDIEEFKGEGVERYMYMDKTDWMDV